jgi:hypothetical protein
MQNIKVLLIDKERLNLFIDQGRQWWMDEPKSLSFKGCHINCPVINQGQVGDELQRARVPR